MINYDHSLETWADDFKLNRIPKMVEEDPV